MAERGEREKGEKMNQLKRTEKEREKGENEG